MTFDARWQEVTCRKCKRAYTCTPEDDYYSGTGGDGAESATSGVCFGCLLKERGMNPQTTPVRVIDEYGAERDPRDLSLKPAGGES